MSSSPPPSIESASSSSNLGSPVTPATALSTSMITSDTSTTPSHQSPSSSSSLNDLADILIQKLDRSKIFPPHLNNPEQLMNLTRRSDERPPRPPNGFLLCRKNVHQEAKINGICNMRVISKVSGMLWRSASPDEKEQYEKLAIQVHNLHSEKYPNYKYRPNNTIVNTNLSHHHHNKLPSATFSPYGLPSPPYSNISTPTIATTLPYFHPNHHHYPGHHHPNHHLVNHHANHQQLNHHSLSHHSLNNNNQNHHQLSHHSPLPHLPHLNHPLPHSQQQLKNITKHHTTNNHVNNHQSSSSHHHHPYANHHHHHHQFIPSSTTVATNNNNTLSPMLSLSSSSLSPSNTNNTNTTTTSPPSTNTTLYNLPIMNELEFSPEQIEMFVSYLSTNNNNNNNNNNNYHNRQY